jgi:hypothetical protein
VHWDARSRIEIAAVDTFYRGRAKANRVIWSIAPDMQTATLKLFAGEAQFLEALTPDAVLKAAQTLFEPVATAGVSRKLRTGALRADGWWLGLADWTLAP